MHITIYVSGLDMNSNQYNGVREKMTDNFPYMIHFFFFSLMGYSNFHFLITMRPLRAPLSVTKLRVIGIACFQKPSVST